jgi:creatinine amidohydrolase
MSINPETLVGLICDLLSSLVQNHVSRVLIINGHDGNIGPIEISARMIKNKHPDMTIACLEAWWVLVGQLKKDLFEVGADLVMAVKQRLLHFSQSAGISKYRTSTKRNCSQTT